MVLFFPRHRVVFSRVKMEMRGIEKLLVNSFIFNFFYTRTVMKNFLDFIGNGVEGNILEIGCGIGETTKKLSSIYQKAKITAIDYDKSQIEKAVKKINDERISFLVGDATELKFQREQFNIVFELNTFHHITDYRKAMKEVHRVLKHGGYFYIMDISKYFFNPLFRIIFPAEVYFSKKEFIDSLNKSGFHIEKEKREKIFFIKARKT